MKYVLSIDGGGIRGLIPSLVLEEIEKKTGKSISELFDLVAGTSTGGILALGLTKNNGSNLPEYSAADLTRIYQEFGGQIFSRSLWKQISSLSGFTDEKYSAEGLELLLEEYFESETMGSLLKKVMITGYDIENLDPVFFKSWTDKYADVAIKSVARATTAAPTYFEPALVDVGGTEKAIIDGGIFVNNPAVSAYAEALRLFPGEEIKLISLGSGQLAEPIRYEKAKNWGAAGWVLPVMDCMFDGVSDAVDYQLRQILGDNFIRLQTTLSVASDAMDDASADNVSALMQEAQMLIEANRSILDSLFD